MTWIQQPALLVEEAPAEEGRWQIIQVVERGLRRYIWDQELPAWLWSSAAPVLTPKKEEEGFTYCTGTARMSSRGVACGSCSLGNAAQQDDDDDDEEEEKEEVDNESCHTSADETMSWWWSTPSPAAGRPLHGFISQGDYTHRISLTTKRLVQELLCLPTSVRSNTTMSATAVMVATAMMVVLLMIRGCCGRRRRRRPKVAESGPVGGSSGDPYFGLRRHRRLLLRRQRSRSNSEADLLMTGGSGNHTSTSVGEHNNNTNHHWSGGGGGGVVRSRTWSRDSNATGGGGGSYIEAGLGLLQQALYSLRLSSSPPNHNNYYWDHHHHHHHDDDDDDDDDYLYDEYWAVNQPGDYVRSSSSSSHQQDVVPWRGSSSSLLSSSYHHVYYGPECSTLTYCTMIPPPKWTDESRRLFTPDPEQWDLRRRLILHLLSEPDNNSNNNDDGFGSRSSIGGGPFLSFAKEAASVSLPALAQPSGKKDSVLVLPVSWVSVHVRQPDLAGVLDLYVKDSPRSEWQENSFESAAMAAQFQLDLLALQCFGEQLVHMYQALCLVHTGSTAFTGRDPVLHDAVFNPEHCLFHKNNNNNNRPEVATSGVAWDDLMRCLGYHFPVLRRRLEALRWYHVSASSLSAATAAVSSSGTSGGGPRRQQLQRKNTSNLKEPAPPVGPKRTPTVDTTVKSAAASSRDETLTTAASGSGGGPMLNNDDAASQAERILLAPEYAGKRFMLGMVDFFRLFVPPVPPVAVPRSTSTPCRVEQLLRWRKRVARAAVLVQAYVRARRVTNRGWRLERPLPAFALKKRLAHDDDLDNKVHDDSVKNEYYEASVSRDILCQVSDANVPPSWWQRWVVNSSTPTLSGYQAYALVAVHCFQWFEGCALYQLQPHRDPVAAIPSLRALLADNPGLDFFVHCIFKEPQRVVIVKVFVRTLPKGIDVKFDRTVERFLMGDEVLRRKKLFSVLQLSVDQSKRSIFSRFLLWWLSFMIRTSTAFLGQARLFQSIASTDDRTLIPAINLSETGQNYHFGGALQRDPTLPNNYFASSVHMDSRRNNNLVTRIMLSYLDAGGLSRGAMDVTYILAGCQPDELPERALASCRFVKVSLLSCSLPPYYINPNDMFSHVHGVVNKTPETVVNLPRLAFRIFFRDPLEAFLSLYSRRRARTMSSAGGTNGNHSGDGDQPLVLRRAVVVASTDPFEKAVNELIDILKDVQIPVRQDKSVNHRGVGDPLLTSLDRNAGAAWPPPLEKTVLVPILRLLTRQDIRRYLIGSDCSFKAAAIRIVQSTAWHHLTFPLDTRACRVELQSGQFFQYGTDLEGSPVYYFRNTLLGPWRKDGPALIAAVLHRLEFSLREFAERDPNVQCTLIVVMGRPFVRRRNKNQSRKDHETKDKGAGESTPLPPSVVGVPDRDQQQQEDVSSRTTSTDDAETLEDGEAFEEAIRKGAINNPRIDPDETWTNHTSKSVMEELTDIVMMHYPERLKRALVVVRHGNRSPYVRTALGGMIALSSLVRSSRTRDKVIFLTRYNDLLRYVDRNELVVIVGGSAPMPPEAFEMRKIRP